MDEIQDGSVNLVLTSPPYWNKRLYTTECSRMSLQGAAVTADKFFADR